MVFKLPNKEQVKFARSAFRDLLNELDSARYNKTTQTTRGNINTPLPELRAAVTKPGVDPRELALNMIRTGRVGGKKISSNERREVATMNDYINTLTKQSEDLTNVYNPGFRTPFTRLRSNRGILNNDYTYGLERKADRILRDYKYKFDEAELRPEDIANAKALQTMIGMKNLESGRPELIPRGVMSKFSPEDLRRSGVNPFNYSENVLGYDKQNAAISKLNAKSGKEDFIDKMDRRFFRGRPSLRDIFEQLNEQGIQRTEAIDDTIISVLPEYEGTAEEFVLFLKSLM